ncbi:MAG: aldehyde dehydrogenase (NADP(+)) [Candidatus Didemnitutus sp.]|nr:aldehyde dehydrogenase (NADP(+)) [Candidatus Didemnitutus sp.]
MNLHGLSLILGQTTRPGGRTFHAVDARIGGALAEVFHEASSDDARAAGDAAASACADYAALPAERRALFLERIATEIEALGDSLLDRCQAETGLPLARLQGERARTCGQLRLFAGLVREGSWVDARIDPALPERTPLPRPDLRRMLVPLGPVVVFGSSNFPFAFSVAGGDTASALAAGCPVIVKAHRSHPGTSERVATAVLRAVAACEVPAGVFSLLHGGGATIGVELVKHPATAAVGFTGSHAAGRALCDAAAARPCPIPVFAEMSSLNPLVILPGALRSRPVAIAQGLCASFTLGVGQFCTKPGLVFTLAGAGLEEFTRQLGESVRACSAAPMLSPSIRTEFLKHRAEVSGVPGVRLLASAPAPERPTDGEPSVVTTTAETFLINPRLATEVFGPFTVVVVAQSFADLRRCLETLDGQLTATLQADPADNASARALLPLLTRRAGRVVMNGFPTGVEVCPAMQHGGPHPATSDARFTSVGTAAILRFARPVCFQNLAPELLPPELQDQNPRGLMRLIDGTPTREPLQGPRR